ncbi:2-amino-4-hydroxy-6-hydroxymethyldihydropteridine diphosphokinase [Pontibacillus yanchengensis]|uniref:2-amino-4-hydroxy-6-hydroxymethyldihydropteridine diphosphokinase n=1 Tax=Pontibacillus yanchengensis Y32 TaxID=1385514 RepID=A0A0A2TRD8_9BACI|nr:2-amino-4-hydroxy-6-hydroxymethyldihydropteridine diphosphokinase [Pontibacillus yanchengensis]KGP71820.1 2-amino-4-hydroxy-6-hydroxymethyldihydropteridine pyrophosphokinase [Pontibacillus yanchengensis Y32]
MKEAYIALGSNIHPRYKFISEAINQLASHSQIEVIQSSAIYETVPVGYTEQGDFLNAVIKIQTNLASVDLLSYCQSIEQELGRERSVEWGPRTIDLDILLFNQENIETEQLIVPHPRLHERAFVLVPLYDIDSHLYIPGYKKTVQQLLSELADDEKKGVRQWKLKNGENASGPTES